MTALLNRMGVPSADCDDVVQQTLIELIVRQTQLERLAPAELHAYAISAAYGTLRKAQRARRRRQRREQQWAECAQIEGAAVEPEDLLVRTEDIFLKLDLMSRLPDWLLGVIIACEVDGRSVTALAGELELPVGTVKSHLRKARVMLKQ